MSISKLVNDMSSFRAEHDPRVRARTKIKAALDKLLKEAKEGWLYEQELLRQTGLSTIHLSRVREEFLKHIVEVSDKKRVWFADPKVAEQARGYVSE